MKIIASIDGQKYLAEVNARELKELNSEVSIQVGAEYEITKAAETLATLRALSQNKLKYIGKYIVDLQAKFEQIEEAYDALMLLDTIKHSEDKDGV
jgi:antitoxin (DNA-binding transcriptional repressor) of toxin-antitoxin stability system